MRSIFTLIVSALLFSSSASADLVIVLNGNDSGQPGSAVGGGSLSSVMRSAADYWEGVFAPDTSISNFTLTIDYQWGALGGGTLGVHSLVSQVNIPPHRETAAAITFDNSNPVTWFLDTNPFDHSEYTTFTETQADLGGGLMVTGRTFSDATGLASGSWDMFSVALHEVGHALGLSSANTAFLQEVRDAGEDDDTVEVENPLPFAGAVIPIELGSAHLRASSFGSALMRPSIPSSIRRLPSHADILANAQISQFNAVNLQIVPEPQTWLAVVLGLGVLAYCRYGRNSSA